jgi:lipoprotein-anchoring transpeptidase ErfK/SrfK
MISNKNSTLCLLLITIAFSWMGCNTSAKRQVTTKKKPVIQRNQPPAFTYSLEKSADWKKQYSNTPNATTMNIVTAVNRTDAANLKSLDSILVPSALSGDIGYYLHFPMQVPALTEIDKIIFFNYSTQTFAAYEYGELLYSGPTSMGRKAHPTPVGLYFCNWKAEKTISTFNDEWELKSNFNIENDAGIGFHQYALPGYPASHSCLRLRETDAKLLYNWAEQWKLNKKEEVLYKGTPVIIFGIYPFDGPKPWMILTTNPAALDQTSAGIEQVLQPYLPSIKEAVRTRNIEQLNSTNG